MLSTQTMAELNIPEPPPANPRMEYPGAQTTISLGDAIVKGMFLLRNLLFFEASDRPHEPIPHSHDTDEALTFFGTNPYDWRVLGGEVELWIEDEKHIITLSCVIFIPKGVKHCPLWVKRVDRPIFHYATLPSIKRIRKSGGTMAIGADYGAESLIRVLGSSAIELELLVNDCGFTPTWN